jgi:mono/diheme cytochrome c family protein
MPASSATMPNGKSSGRMARVLLGGFVGLTTVAAHDIITTKLTYTRDISRIFAFRCVGCHSSSALVSLTNYDEVRPWAVDIKEQVLKRAMPPWGAVKGFGDLLPDHALTQEEILIISAWVVGGAPKGDPALLSSKIPPAHDPVLPPLHHALDVLTNVRLSRSLKLAAVTPLAQEEIDSVRIIARLPDGRIEPLVWLYRFSQKGNKTYRFRQPLDLPPGTVVESSRPLRFALEELAGSGLGPRLPGFRGSSQVR